MWFPTLSYTPLEKLNEQPSEKLKNQSEQQDIDGLLNALSQLVMASEFSSQRLLLNPLAKQLPPDLQSVDALRLFIHWRHAVAPIMILLDPAPPGRSFLPPALRVIDPDTGVEDSPTWDASLNVFSRTILQMALNPDHSSLLHAILCVSAAHQHKNSMAKAHYQQSMQLLNEASRFWKSSNIAEERKLLPAERVGVFASSVLLSLFELMGQYQGAKGTDRIDGAARGYAREFCLYCAANPVKLPSDYIDACDSFRWVYARMIVSMSIAGHKFELPIDVFRKLYRPASRGTAPLSFQEGQNRKMHRTRGISTCVGAADAMIYTVACCLCAIEDNSITPSFAIHCWDQLVSFPALLSEHFAPTTLGNTYMTRSSAEVEQRGRNMQRYAHPSIAAIHLFHRAALLRFYLKASNLPLQTFDQIEPLQNASLVDIAIEILSIFRCLLENYSQIMSDGAKNPGLPGTVGAIFVGWLPLCLAQVVFQKAENTYYCELTAEAVQMSSEILGLPKVAEIV